MVSMDVKHHVYLCSIYSGNAGTFCKFYGGRSQGESYRKDFGRQMRGDHKCPFSGVTFKAKSETTELERLRRSNKQGS